MKDNMRSFKEASPAALAASPPITRLPETRGHLTAQSRNPPIPNSGDRTSATEANRHGWLPFDTAPPELFSGQKTCYALVPGPSSFTRKNTKYFFGEQLCSRRTGVFEALPPSPVQPHSPGDVDVLNPSGHACRN